LPRIRAEVLCSSSGGRVTALVLTRSRNFRATFLVGSKLQGFGWMTQRTLSEGTTKSHLQQNIQHKEQNVPDISTADSSGEAPIHLHEPIQSEEIMATRFHEDIPEASIQTRTEIQEESKAKVGKTEMDEGC
jgi:hypothetical protein